MASRARAMFQKISRGDWSPYTAETIEQNFERLYKWSADPVTADRGGLGLTSFVVGDLLVADSTSTIARLADVAVGKALISGGVGVLPAWGKIQLSGSVVHVTGTLPVTLGGTGLATLAQGDILYGGAADSLSLLVKDANATRYLSNTGTSNNPAWAQVELTNGVTGVLPPANGGLGIATPWVVGDFIYANSTTTWARFPAGAAGTFLRGLGAGVVPAWSVLTFPNVLATGELLQATATNVASALAAVTAGSYLRSAGSGTANVWSTLKIPNAAAQGEIPIASAADTITMLGVGTAGQILSSNGAGADPSWGGLPAAASGTWSVLTDGDATQPELIFAGGDVIMTFTP